MDFWILSNDLDKQLKTKAMPICKALKINL